MQLTKDEIIKHIETPEYAKQRLAFIQAQPTPAARKQFHVDYNGFLYVDLLPDGRRLWVVRQPGSKGTCKRTQKVLGEFAALSYAEATYLEEEWLYDTRYECAA